MSFISSRRVKLLWVVDLSLFADTEVFFNLRFRFLYGIGFKTCFENNTNSLSMFYLGKISSWLCFNYLIELNFFILWKLWLAYRFVSFILSPLSTLINWFAFFFVILNGKSYTLIFFWFCTCIFYLMYEYYNYFWI